jgi:hypothetical protein
MKWHISHGILDLWSEKSLISDLDLMNFSTSFSRWETSGTKKLEMLQKSHNENGESGLDIKFNRVLFWNVLTLQKVYCGM